MVSHNSNSLWPEIINQALDQPCGARFYRCALQVNPFEYVQRHGHSTSFNNEEEYNAAIVEALIEQEIEIIAITDHYRINTSQSLVKAASDQGIYVFKGFEAVTKDGVHVLCLFNFEEDFERINRFIGECGVHDDNGLSPIGDKDFDNLLKSCTEKWNGICIAAHVCSNGGLLKTLNGQSAIHAWQHEHLYACALPGPIDRAPTGQRPIIENKNPDYYRERPVAVINAQDISSPREVQNSGSFCSIKMTDISVEGLRQAFLDPKSRIRLTSDEELKNHTQLLAISWEGGFLDGTTIKFNENLNVLIGGRGTGKSTVIESIRFALQIESKTEQVDKQHRSFVSHVLNSGTKVSLLIRSYKPSLRDYLIERTVKEPATVKDDTGAITELTPADIAKEVEIYGQHEISELARSPQHLTSLLNRFIDPTNLNEDEKSKIEHRLEDTRHNIQKIEKQLSRINEELQSLPGLKEQYQRFKDLGLDERLEDKKQIIKEQRTIETLEKLIQDLSKQCDDFQSNFPLDISSLDAESLEGFGGAHILKKADPIFKQLEQQTQIHLSKLNQVIETSQSQFDEVKTEWKKRSSQVEEEYKRILRELQKEGIDGNEYTEIIKKIENLQPKIQEQNDLQQELEQEKQKRRQALREWEDFNATKFRELRKASKRVNRKLNNLVRVSVKANGELSPLKNKLNNLQGRKDQIIKALEEQSEVSVQELAQTCREGKDALVNKYNISSHQATTLASAGNVFFMEIEELDLPDITTIELNVAGENATPVWRTLEQLSTGQKATAVLMLLLLDADGPLIIDQPEDDLDNRFIADQIVPRVKHEKNHRQFVFATHNANIPVLGDAELIMGLIPTESEDSTEVHLPRENLGSIDSLTVRTLVEETLEGGKTAFEFRRLKYGF